MISDQLLTMLKSDPRNSTELSEASGVHGVAIRRLRTGARPLTGITLATAEQLAKALGARLHLDAPNKSKNKA